MLSFAEENYLKTIYHLSEGTSNPVSTNAIADTLNTRAASVTDMIKKLSNKGVVTYQKYRGVRVSEEGQKAALQVIRKHRLWEVFLVQKLKFNWDEVHDVAEQLEHIKSPLLIRRLDEFLGYPKYDPHGDPIPDESGEFKAKPQVALSDCKIGHDGVVVAVKDASAAFLQYVDKIGAYIGAKIRVIDRLEFDGSLEILIDNKKTVFISKEVSENIWIEE
ncbi:Mn-dependent transcriptional regulator MntR [Fulvivirga imtechensis AK7]|uniref:Transcriptional regulator MntR n=1 Tax=Fulvivirga imtechensis AK7 TaxID=1237149 RepID=L8JKR5_9BACT|nr:metal-dependent transcriptional regulator [Fulvivirga imtechensis]ELR68798.1 Mn-dependent transcriptional regulator MntR [Fulvivirga imtechensis AK7]